MKKIILGILLMLVTAGIQAAVYCPQNILVICKGKNSMHCYTDIPNWQFAGGGGASEKVHSGLYSFVSALDTSPNPGFGPKAGDVQCNYLSVDGGKVYAIIDQGHQKTLTADMSGVNNWRLDEVSTEYVCGDDQNFTSAILCPFKKK